MANKPQPYMNRREREKFLFAHNAKVIVDVALSEPNLPKAARTAFKTAGTWLNKGAEAWVADKDKDTIAQLKREAGSFTLTLAHQKDADKIAEKTMLEDAALRNRIIEEIGRDPIFDVCHVALSTTCKYCDGTPATTTGCDLANAMLTLRIPTWDHNAQAKCPYAYCGLTDDEVRKAEAEKAELVSKEDITQWSR